MAFARMPCHGLWSIVPSTSHRGLWSTKLLSVSLSFIHFQNMTSGSTFSLCVSLRHSAHCFAFRHSLWSGVVSRASCRGLGPIVSCHTAAFGRPNWAPGGDAEDKKSKRRRLEKNAMAREGTAKLQQLIFEGRSIL